jgi:hypothetical protein
MSQPSVLTLYPVGPEEGTELCGGERSENAIRRSKATAWKVLRLKVGSYLLFITAGMVVERKPLELELEQFIQSPPSSET